jgi:hypothetical protein
MKAIISHDIDHITVWEHLFRDTILPKYFMRMHIEVFSGRISMREYLLRWADFFRNKWQNIDELITFNNMNAIPSSFFIAVNRGLGLNYSNESALLWIEQMRLRQCEIGIHGMAFDNQAEIDDEFARFSALTGKREFGIRMHYVRKTEDTLEMLSKAGYVYDSTEFAFRDPYKIGTMWEFPLQIMDGWIIENYRPWQSLDLAQAKTNTLRILDKVQEQGLNYICIDFHDRYFSHAFKTWLDWYMWLVEHLKTNGVEFVNYREAVNRLEHKATN